MNLLPTLVIVILPSIISILVILYFRRTDKERFQLTKLKKFTDVISSQFDDLIKEKQNEVTQRMSELQTVLNRSRNQSEELSQQLLIVEKKVTELNSKDGVLNRVDAKLLQINTTASECQDALIQVENERDDAKQWLTQISSLKQNLQQVSDELTQNQTYWDTWCKEKLNGLNQKIEEEFQTASVRMKQQLDTQYQTCMDSFGRLQRDQSVWKKELNEQKIQVNSEILGLKTQFHQTQEKLESNFNQRCTTLAGVITQQKKSIEQCWNGLKKNLELTKSQFSKDAKQGLDGLYKEVEQVKFQIVDLTKEEDDIRKRLLQLSQQQQETLDKEKQHYEHEFKEYTKLTETKLNEFIGRSADNINNRFSLINDQMDTLKVDVDGKSDDIQNRLTYIETNVKNQVNQSMEMLLKSVDEERKKVNKQTNHIGVFLGNFLDTEKQKIKDEITSVVNEMKQEYRYIEKKYSNVKLWHESMDKELKGYSDQICSQYEIASKEVQDKFHKDLQLMHFSVNDKSNLLMDNYNQLKSNLESDFISTKHDLKKEKEQILIYYQESKKQLDNKNRELGLTLSAIQEEQDKELATIVQQFQLNYEKAEQDYILNNSRLLKTTQVQVREIGSELKDMQDNFKNLSESSMNMLEGQVENYKREFVSLTSNMEKYVSDKENKIIHRMDDKTKSLTQKIVEMDNQVNTTKENTLREMTRRSNDMELSLGRLEQKCKELIDTKIKENINQLEGMTESVEQVKLTTQKDCEQLLNAFREKVEKIGRELETKLVSRVDKSTVSLTLNVEKLQSDLSKRIKGFLTKTEMKIENMDTEIKRILNYDLSIEEFNQRFDYELEKIQQQLLQSRDKLIEDSRQEYQILHEEQQFLSDRITEFKKESRIFSKADKFYDKFKDELDEAKDYLVMVRDEKVEIRKMEGHIRGLLAQRSELDDQMAQFESNKSELSYVGRQVEQILSILSDVESRYGKMNQQLGKLNDVNARLSHMTEMYESTENKVTELQHLKDSLTDEIKNINEMRATTQELTQRISYVQNDLNAFMQQKEQLMNELQNVQEEAAQVKITDDRIDRLVSKFSQLDSFAIDVDKRIEQFNIFKKKLKETETHFVHIQKEADDKIDKLNQILNELQKQMVDSNGESKWTKESENETMEPSNVDINLDTKEKRKEAVLKLYKKGFDIARISGLLNLSKSEIKLILDIERARIKR